MVTVQDLLHELPDIRVRVAGSGPQREVRWVHVSELDDPTPYLRGDELVLSAGVHFPRTAAAVHAYVARLVAHGVSGLGFGVAPVHTKVPARLVSACEEQGLLLLEVPPPVPFIAISEAHVRLLEAQRARATAEMTRTQRRIVRASLRPAPLQSVISVMAHDLRAGVVLADLQRGDRWCAGSLPAKPELEDVLLRVASAPDGGSEGVYAGGRHVVVQSVETPLRRLALAVCATQRLSTAQHGVVNVAATVVALVLGRGSASPLASLGAATATALCGGSATDLQPLVARALGVGVGDQWTVLACAPAQPARGAQDWRRWLAHVSEVAGTPLVARERESALVLVPTHAGAVNVADLITSSGDLVGLSDPSPLPDLPAAAAQARRSLSIARVSRTHRPGQSGPTVSVDSLVNPQAARGFAHAVLGSVLALDDKEAETLLCTLRRWLENHGSWDRAATELRVHRNTVRNRIDKLSRLLDRDLDDATSRMELFFALGWLDES